MRFDCGVFNKIMQFISDGNLTIPLSLQPYSVWNKWKHWPQSSAKHTQTVILHEKASCLMEEKRVIRLSGMIPP